MQSAMNTEQIGKDQSEERSVQQQMISSCANWYKQQTKEQVNPPEVGMIFSSPDEAFQFYKQYACQTGFGFTRRTSHNFYGLKYDATFACTKNLKPAYGATDAFAIRSRGILGTGCRARVVLRD